MINLFPVAPFDRSIDYLKRVFGSVNGILPGGDITLLGQMFAFFNSVLLTVAVLGVIYITVVGVIKTAHEGEFMGKQWNNIWLPIRALLGISFLVPTSTGYSAIQIVLMWIVVQGIGAADGLWNRALSTIDLLGSPYAQASIPTIGIAPQFEGLFKGIVCEASARLKNPNPMNPSAESGPGSYFCYKNNSSFCSTNPPLLSNDKGVSTFELGPTGQCGKLNYCNETTECAETGSLRCSACQLQKTTLNSTIKTFRDIAVQFVNADYAYRVFYATSGIAASDNWQWIYKYCKSKDGSASPKTCCVKNPIFAFFGGGICEKDNPNLFSPNQPPQSAPSELVKDIYWPFWPDLKPSLQGGTEDFTKIPVTAYISGLMTVYKEFIDKRPISDDNEWMNEAKNSGWIMAGGWYLKIAKLNKQNLQELVPPLGWNENSNTNDPMIKTFRNNYAAAQALISASRGSQAGSQSSLMQGPVGDVAGNTKESLSDVVQKISNQTPEGAGNPLVAIQGVGIALIVIAEVLFFVLLALLTTTGILGYLSVLVLGTGVPTNPIGPTISLVTMFLLPLLYFLFASLIAMGALLSIYTPLIPFIFFSFAAIGWLLSVVEAMVAGPLIALIMISPRGEHEILGNAHHSLMIIFDTFLRPSMLIFGLFAAMLLASAVIFFINEAFWKAIITGGFALGDPLSTILILAAYVMIVLAALNKSFGVINELPNQVLQYIGGRGREARTPEQEIKGGISTTAGKAGGAASGTGTSARQADKVATDQEAKRKAAVAEAARLSGDVDKNKPPGT